MLNKKNRQYYFTYMYNKFCFKTTKWVVIIALAIYIIHNLATRWLSLPFLQPEIQFQFKMVCYSYDGTLNTRKIRYWVT